MSVPSLPDGYDVSKHVSAGRSDSLLTVGFDRYRGHIPCFLVQLHYRVETDPVSWMAIARMDHNEATGTGHDVYREGLHVDVARRTAGWVHLTLPEIALPTSRGALIRECVEYFRREAAYFVDVYRERQEPGRPPRWSDGGESTSGFISLNAILGDMSGDFEGDGTEPLRIDELTDLLAEAEQTSSEALKREARTFAIAPPHQATIVEE